MCCSNSARGGGGISDSGGNSMVVARTAYNVLSSSAGEFDMQLATDDWVHVCLASAWLPHCFFLHVQL